MRKAGLNKRNTVLSKSEVSLNRRKAGLNKRKAGLNKTQPPSFHHSSSQQRVASATWADVGIEKDSTFEGSGG